MAQHNSLFSAQSWESTGKRGTVPRMIQGPRLMGVRQSLQHVAFKSPWYTLPSQLGEEQYGGVPVGAI